MQNKTKLILVVAVLLGGIFLGGNTLAADQCTLNGGVCVSCPVSCTNVCADNGYTSDSKLTAYNNDCSLAVPGVCCAKSIVPPAQDCACGSSDRGSFATAPTSNLCQTGTASATRGDGPWTWSCGEGDSCKTVSCSATKSSATTNCVCGSSDRGSFTTVPSSNLCQTGTASAIRGDGPWTWSCGEACGTVGCSANKTGSSGADSCTSGTCQPTTSCDSFGVGTCADAKNRCCLDKGTPIDPSKPISPGPGITFPTDTGLPTNPNLVKGIFTNVANFLLSIIGIIAIISFVISGIQYFLVATDEKMMETAKKTMVASIIGLVVALFGYIAVKTVEMLLKG